MIEKSNEGREDKLENENPTGHLMRREEYEA